MESGQALNIKAKDPALPILLQANRASPYKFKNLIEAEGSLFPYFPDPQFDLRTCYDKGSACCGGAHCLGPNNSRHSSRTFLEGKGGIDGSISWRFPITLLRIQLRFCCRFWWIKVSLHYSMGPRTQVMAHTGI